MGILGSKRVRITRPSLNGKTGKIQGTVKHNGKTYVQVWLDKEHGDYGVEVLDTEIVYI